MYLLYCTVSNRYACMKSTFLIKNCMHILSCCYCNVTYVVHSMNVMVYFRVVLLHTPFFPLRFILLDVNSIFFLGFEFVLLPHFQGHNIRGQTFQITQHVVHCSHKTNATVFNIMFAANLFHHWLHHIQLMSGQLWK